MNYLRYKGNKVPISAQFVQKYRFYLLECTTLEEALNEPYKVCVYCLGRIDNEKELNEITKICDDLIEKR